MSPSKLKQLQKIWYKKLRDSGFDDIENGEKSVIRSQEFNLNANYTLSEAYQNFCKDLLEHHNFKTERERFIFELHSEGRAETFIEEQLKISSFKPIKRSAIGSVIRNVIKKFKAKQFG